MIDASTDPACCGVRPVPLRVQYGYTYFRGNWQLKEVALRYPAQRSGSGRRGGLGPSTNGCGRVPGCVASDDASGSCNIGMNSYQRSRGQRVW